MGFGIDVVGIGAVLDMLESLKFEFGDGVVYIVGPTVEYAIYHEMGTSKMKARPFARPAAERVQANLDTKIGGFLDGGLGSAGEEEILQATALAVEAEMKRIITQKGLIDTGTMRASVRIEKVN
jgi:hypothetical protein